MNEMLPTFFTDSFILFLSIFVRKDYYGKRPEGIGGAIHRACPFFLKNQMSIRIIEIHSVCRISVADMCRHATVETTGS